MKDVISAFLLDTPIIVLPYLGQPLPKRTREILADPATERLISPASIMELAIKGEELKMSEENLREAIRDLRLDIIPFTPQQAYRLFSLPLHHRDPFDRMLISTALAENIPLIGGDHIFNQYAGLKVIWK